MTSPLVCGAGPPPNGKGARQAPIPKLLLTAPTDTAHACFAQAGTIWRGWSREAARMFREFWRTGDDKHLRAFAAHVYAMRMHYTDHATFWHVPATVRRRTNGTRIKIETNKETSK